MFFRPLDVLENSPRREILPVVEEGLTLVSIERYFSLSSISFTCGGDWRLNNDTSNFDSERCGIKGQTLVGSWEIQVISHFNNVNDMGLGAGFSGVMGEALELHASFMYDKTYQKYFNSLISSEQYFSFSDPMEFRDIDGGTKWLVGGSYTWGNNLTMSLEYWHDDSGYSESELNDLVGLAREQRHLFIDGDISGDIRDGNIQWSSQVYRQQNLLERYAAVRFSFIRDEQSLASYFIYSVPDDGWIGNVRYENDVGRNHNFSLGVRYYGGDENSAYKNFFTKYQVYFGWEGVFSL
ncbi:MAG: hypothetical protein K6L81_04365 [Agarilytica sp.]